MPWRRPLAALALAAGLLLPAAHAAEPANDSGVPRLVVAAPQELAGLGRRVAEIEPRWLTVTLRWTGLEASPAPIRLFLVPESEPLAHSTPRWVAGFANSAEEVVVIFPARVPRYPYDSLESVVVHEVAHVLVGRATGGRPVPRWFNEGLAMAAARDVELADRTELTWGLLSGGPDDLATVEAAFAGGESQVQAAYAFAGLLVRAIAERAGPAAPGELLRRVREGESFEAAFQTVVGEPLADFARSFFRRQRLWHRWFPLLTSSTFLWTLILLLAFWARRRRRRRDAELARRWELEEELARLRQEREALWEGEAAEELEDEAAGEEGAGPWVH